MFPRESSPGISLVFIKNKDGYDDGGSGGKDDDDDDDMRWLVLIFLEQQ